MGKVYAPPREIGDVPNLSRQPFSTYQTEEKAYVEKVQKWARENGQGDLAGEEVFFPFADGYARYVVLKTRPVRLIHLPIGDAWSYPYIERLTEKDIRERVRQKKAVSKLFAAK